MQFQWWFCMCSELSCCNSAFWWKKLQWSRLSQRAYCVILHHHAENTVWNIRNVTQMIIHSKQVGAFVIWIPVRRTEAFVSNALKKLRYSGNLGSQPGTIFFKICVIIRKDKETTQDTSDIINNSRQTQYQTEEKRQKNVRSETDR